MTYSVSLTEDQIFSAMQAFLQNFTGATEVWKADDNRVPLPDGPFIAMTPVSRVILSTTTAAFSIPLQAATQTQPVKYGIQLDFYGINAADWAAVASAIFWSDLGCAFFEPYGIDPLYNDDPKFMALVNGEQQYEARWTMTAYLQCNISVAAPAQFMSNAIITIANVSTLPR